MAADNCVVFFSGGATSWAAGKRAVKAYGAAATTLMFTDTLIEDRDLYRFLIQAAANVFGLDRSNAVADLAARAAKLPPGIPADQPGHAERVEERRQYLAALAADVMEAVPGLVWLADGRTPWQVFDDKKILAHSAADPCSRILKREIAERWIKENRDPARTALVFGLDWQEGHRYDDGDGHGVKNRYMRIGWPHVEAPMMEAPYLLRPEVLQWMRLEGLTPSRAYTQSLAHDNCGGGCVKAGRGHWAHLLRVRPDVYAEWEAGEEAFNAKREGKRVQTIMKVQTPGKPTRLVSMREFREKIEGGAQVDMFEIGGCGCFLEDAA